MIAKMQKKKGFTLIEVLISVLVVIALISVVVPSFSSFRNQRAMENSVNLVISVLNEARSKTLSATGDTFYSTRIENEKVILFSGSSYDLNNATNKLFYYDKPVTLLSVSLNGGGSDISFARLKGNTDNYGTIVLQLPNGTTRAITVTNTGTVAKN